MKRILARLLLGSLVVSTVPAAAAGDTHGSIFLNPARVHYTDIQAETSALLDQATSVDPSAPAGPATPAEQPILNLLPGSTHPIISVLKQTLVEYGLAEHTQLRTATASYYDGKLEVLVQTLCAFCQYPNAAHVINPTVCYIIQHLGDLSETMRQDIRSAYIQKLCQTQRDGCLSYTGQVYYRYAFTQTDPEWFAVPYPYGSDDSRIMGRSACGPAAVSIVLSSWLHREVLPTEVARYSLTHGFRTSTGTNAALCASIAAHYGAPAPVSVDGTNFAAMYQGIRNQGHMAVAKMKPGHFTLSGHYIAIVGARERNGGTYFLIADPNYPNPRYYGLGDDLIDDDPADPFILARTSIIAQENKGIYWFPGDFLSFTPSYQTSDTEILPAVRPADETAVP